MKRLAIALLVLSSFAERSACASNAATANMGATLVAAISVSTLNNLNFGFVVPGSTVGTVVMLPNFGAPRSATGGAVLGNLGSASAGRFWVDGKAGSTYAITLPGSITVSDGTNSMTVNTFTSFPASTGTVPGDLWVGATAQVGANQVFTAPFSGTFSVTVNYN